MTYLNTMSVTVVSSALECGLMTVQLDQRFWSKVDVADCWVWTSAVDFGGYGIFWIGSGVSRKAHRLAYESLVGTIPDGLTLDHLCRNRSCVNPDHLEPCTSGENARRSPLAPYNVKARWTHCKRGHEFTRENTLIRSARRSCRICTDAAVMSRRAQASEHRRDRTAGSVT